MKNALYLRRLVLLLCLITVSSLRAQTFTNLHSFSPATAGYRPMTSVIVSGNKVLGSVAGGTNGSGAIYSVNTDGTGFTNIYSFSAATNYTTTGYTNADGLYYIYNSLNGVYPCSLVLSGSTLYGTMSQGGIHGAGTIFSIQTNGTGFTLLHAFSPAPTSNPTNQDGAEPGALLLSGNTLFGVTSTGGTNGSGTVFKMNTDGSGFTTLHMFSALAPSYSGSSLYLNNDGSSPMGPLVLAGNTLIGAAYYGNTNGRGALFQVNTNGTGFKVVHSFDNGYYDYNGVIYYLVNNDGANPNSLILSGNTVYGVAQTAGPGSGGVLFKMNTNGTGFGLVCTNVSYPLTPLLVSGNTLFGVNGEPTTAGTSYGSVFSVHTDGTGYTDLYNFSNGGDGAWPRAGLVMSGKTLYGTCEYAGIFDGTPFGMGFGTVYGLTLSSLPLSVATTSLSDGKVSTAYSQTLAANGGQAPYSWTNISGTLPKGLTLAASGLLSGTPTTNGTFNFTVQVTDALAATATQPLSAFISILDVVKPSCLITNLTAGQRCSNSTFAVKGTAGDNVAVSNVWVRLNNGNWSSATPGNGWTNWSAILNLIPGTNNVAARAQDTSGNLSTTNQVSLDFVVTNQVGIRAAGLGAISPNYSNAWLEIGRNYTITSSPAAGFVAANWVLSTNWLNGVTTNGNVAQFMMGSNLTLEVNFADVTRPTNTLSSPANGQHMTNALATIVGSAKDNWKVIGVWYQFNNGAWMMAPSTNGWTNWSTTLHLVTGTNSFKAYAGDFAGNFSTTNSLSVVSSNSFRLQLAFTNNAPLKSNGLNLQLQLSPGLNGHIQVSTNLVAWTTLTNFVGSATNLNFRDSAATNGLHRFYRAVIP